MSSSTPAAKRSDHVNTFNKSSQERCCTSANTLDAVSSHTYCHQFSSSLAPKQVASDSTSSALQDFASLIPTGTQGVTLYITAKSTHVPHSSHDLQSMARIHRFVTNPPIVLNADFCWVPSDGQKRSVYIYRFLTAGTIDGESL
jgi:hypothetical protein